VCVTLSGCLSDPTNETGALPTTLTELYQTATDHFEKYHHRNADRNSRAHEALKKLQRLAFLGMESGQLVFNQTLFDEEMKISGLLNSLSNPIFPLRTQFCFIHLTIQEFLAARHVTETFAPPEIKKFISDHVESGKWHLVLQFIAGLLGKKINDFDREYKDCIFAFAESLEVTDGEIEVGYHEVFIMKCLREADDEEITKEVCETTAINDLIELVILPASYNLSASDWAAVTFVCKHVKKWANLTLFGWDTDCLPDILGLLRKRFLNKLHMPSAPYPIADEVFSALMKLNCTLDHKHTTLTSLTLNYLRMTETGLQIVCKFFENGHASQLEQLTLTSHRIDSPEISKLCEVLNNGHCPNLTHLDLGNNSMRDEGVMVLCDTLTKGLRKLNSLDVRECKLTDRCIPTLVKALQDERCQLTVLSLSKNAIGDKGACMLFEDALTKEHCKLTELDLDKCSLTDQCIPSLCKALQDERCQLNDLKLAFNAIGDESACMLFEDALTKEHCKLAELSLDACSLTDQCIPSLCKALQGECCQLTVVSLRYNAIGDKGAGMLFEDALTKEHCKLTELNLLQCLLTDECIPSLCKALQDSQCVLTRLFLLLNNFTENGKKLLRDTMNYESCKARGLQIVV
jgi:Ran GTPase-activating protein (RanGAP) involved in mRNA processing and transport